MIKTWFSNRSNKFVASNEISGGKMRHEKRKRKRKREIGKETFSNAQFEVYEALELEQIILLKQLLTKEHLLELPTA